MLGEKDFEEFTTADGLETLIYAWQQAAVQVSDHPTGRRQANLRVFPRNDHALSS